MAKANVTICEAQMGEGKTNTMAAIGVDDIYGNVYAVKSPDGKIFKVKPHHHDIVESIPSGMLIKIPKDWEILTHARIFANFHFYGIPAVYCTASDMISWLNNGTIQAGKLFVDEAYIEGEARRGMSPINVLVTWFGQQMRKRNIELYIIVQHGRFIDWRFRYIAKRRILTQYSEKTHFIRVLIQDLTKGTEKVIRYWAPQYWEFFDTNELPEIPEAMIEKALAAVARR